MKSIIITIALIILCSACQNESEFTTYTPPIELNLYECIEPECAIKSVVPAGTELLVISDLITIKDEHWKYVVLGDVAGYIGKWQRNFPYYFTGVRACAGYDCPIIDEIDANTYVLYAGGETHNVVQFWQRIVYEGDKVGYMGPISPGPSKSYQMTTEATRNALLTQTP